MRKDDWRVGKGQKSCSACGRRFQPGRTFFSALTREEGEFRRTDYCRRCWQETGEEGFFSYWKTRERGEEEEQQVDSAVLKDLFWRLEDPQNAREKAFRFVLALYLCRRKTLALAGSGGGEDGKVLLFESRESDELIRVEDPGLDDAQLEQVTARLKELLQMDL